MKKLKKVVVVLFVLLCIAYYLLFGSPLVDWRNAKLAEATQNIGSEPITLEELVPFAWDAVYEFEPYTSKEEIAKTIGFYSVEINESWTESANWYYFVKGNRIVSNPEDSSLGCSISLPNGSLRYGEYVLFETVEGHTGYSYLQPAKRGTVETFSYNDLRLQIDNVHSMRTETYTDSADPTYQWECVIFTYYPGAEIRVLNADQITTDDGKIHPQWKISRVDEDGKPLPFDLGRDIIDTEYPITINKNMYGVYHYESMIHVLKFEQVKQQH